MKFFPSPTMKDNALNIRIFAGFNASSFTAGLLALTDQTSGTAGAYLRHLFPSVDAGLSLKQTYVGSVSGWTATVLTPAEHSHRHPEDIEAVYRASRLSNNARRLAMKVWGELIRAEAKVHGMPESEVHFHEVGRMSNILNIGLCAEFLTTLDLLSISASPIPMNDSEIVCAHGTVPYPAPATLAMLEGVAVRPSSGVGELITPTGLAVLKGFGAKFGKWPEMLISNAVNVFVPNAVFPGTANGARFILGSLLPEEGI